MSYQVGIAIKRLLLFSQYSLEIKQSEVIKKKKNKMQILELEIQ